MIYYARLCLRYWWIILIITVITTLSSAYLSIYYIAPVYSTSTTMYILKMNNSETNNESVYQNLLASEMLVQDYKEMVKTSIIIQGVKDELQDEFPTIKAETLKSLSENITVSTKPETRLIDITVKQKDPKAAAAIANKTAEIFKEKSFEILKTESVTIMNTASVPTAPVSPKPLQDIIMSFLAGFIGSIALILFIDFIRKQLKAEKLKEAAV